MATNAKKDACQLTNPRLANQQQVIGMFAAAMGTASKAAKA
jgi:alcohol dehydrogenase